MWWTLERIRKISCIVTEFLVRAVIVLLGFSFASCFSCHGIYVDLAEDYNLFSRVILKVLFIYGSILVYHCTASFTSSFVKHARELSLQLLELYQLQQDLNVLNAHVNQLLHLQQQMNNMIADDNQGTSSIVKLFA